MIPLRSAAWAVVAFGALVAGPLSAQEKEPGDEPFRKDPYTKNDPAAIQAAGYLSYHPFSFADGARTEAVERVLGDGVEMLWVETAHFKIGSSLPEYLITEPEERERVKEELERLRIRIPKIKPKERKLDPWLRLHLYAQRCEEIYAEFERQFGLAEVRFPSSKGSTVDGVYRGEGPYWGMGDKFTVLLFEKESSYGRVKQKYLQGIGGDSSARYLFSKSDGMLFAAHVQGSSMDSDTVLHCAVAYNLVHNFVDSTCHYSFPIPVWMSTGLAHVHARAISPKQNYFTEDKSYTPDEKDIWNWPPRIYARVKNEVWPPAAKLFAATDAADFKYTDHMMAWSRMDYLLREHPAAMGAYLLGVKAQIAQGRAPTSEEIAAQHDRAFAEAFGIDAAGFDTAWTEWVLKNYPKK